MLDKDMDFLLNSLKADKVLGKALDGKDNEEFIICEEISIINLFDNLVITKIEKGIDGAEVYNENLPLQISFNLDSNVYTIAHFMRVLISTGLSYEFMEGHFYDEDGRTLFESDIEEKEKSESHGHTIH